ncbi:beta strand repeat-containing protein, partial [Adonisia turfae]|uniref:beta strand repeat-containing protein n=1 Tax=Adonisia turfae TaxID=2950184 RepID=UPI0032B33CB8
MVSATGVNGGEVVLDATEGGSLLSGTVTAAASTGNGGRVEILGGSSNLAGTTVDVSGDAGGGEILVGGDYQGQGDTPTAQDTLVNESAVLTADARVDGDGGRVIVWADETTRFGGEISARGGELGGDGGFVEVSGKEGGVFAGLVDAGSNLGEGGTLLLDPKNIIIENGGTRSGLIQSYFNPTPENDDFFGDSVAVDGNNIVISSRLDDTVGVNAGASYLFDTNGNLLQTLFNPIPEATTFNDNPIAIDGNNIVVGVPGTNDEVGVVYLFNISGELLQTFSNPTPNTDDWFGNSVAIDENNIVIGARGDGLSGAAYLFDTNGNLLRSFLDSTPGDPENFGVSVAIDKDNIVIGASNTDAGAPVSGTAYLFDTNGNLLQSFSDPSPEFGDFFGISVAIDGDSIVISADDSAFLFNTDGASLATLRPPLPSRRVDIDEGNIIIGTPTNGTDSAAYLFDTDGELLQSFLAPAPDFFGDFGNAVAISGSNVVIGMPNNDTGAPRAGSTYLFSTNLKAQPTLYSESSDESFIFDADLVTEVTNTGTNIVLQANNDLVVNETILTENIFGVGGSLSFQSGRSLLINADISTDDGNITLISNDTLLNGVIDEFRDPGVAEIQMAPGTTINAGLGNIQVTLDNGAGLTNNESGNVTLNNINAENLTVYSDGGIVGNGILNISGDATFTSNLANAGTVSVTNTEPSVIGYSIIGGDFILNSAEPISQVPGEPLQVARDISVNGAVSESLVNTLGLVSINETLPNGDKVITNVGPVNLEGQTVSGNLIVNSLPIGVLEFPNVFEAPAITLDQANSFGGTLRFRTNLDGATALPVTPGITQSGTQIISNVATLNANGGDIVLDDVTNQFGSIDFSGANVTLAEQNGTRLEQSEASGDFTLTSGGLITQTGRLAIAGNTDITTTQSDKGTVSLRNTAATVLGNSLIGENFTIDSGGTISQAPQTVLQVAGDTTILNPAGTPDFTIDPADILGRIELANGDVTITKVGEIELDAETFTGNLTVTSLAERLQFIDGVVFNDDAINLSTEANLFGGTVSLTTDAPTTVVESETPSITQNGAIQVNNGAATFTAEAGSITLDEPTNAFNRLAFNSGDVSIAEGEDINLLESTATSGLGLISDGEINQSSRLIVDGGANFTSLQPDSSINLTGSNQFTGEIE